MKILISILAFVFIGCQTQPTKVFEKQPTVEKSGGEIPAGTVVLDARPSFDYTVSHIPDSLNMAWQDFVERDEHLSGLLEADLFAHARRLARMGIGPDTSVIVVGRGFKGDGEEGRLAWTLKVLGIKNVRFTHIDSFSIPLQTSPPPALAPVAMWKPAVDESLRINKKEFLKEVMQPRGGATVVIDVRTEKEYLGKDPSFHSQKAPDINAINIPWTEFITSRGEAKSSIRDRLQQVGITPDKRILIISAHGVRSAAVTIVLRELGYSKATNFAGGYLELLGKR